MGSVALGGQGIDTVTLVVLIIGILGVYFVPSFVAYSRERSLTIFSLNLLLGWTIIGWIVALLWAIDAKDKTKRA